MLFSGQLLSQKNSDTTISKRTIDSLKTEIHLLRSKANVLSWKYKVATEVKKLDTTLNTFDSITIRYLTNDGKILKKQRVLFDKSGCKTHTTDYYYSNDTLLQYVEYWRYNCSKAEDNDPSDYTITDYLQRCDRFLYDSKGRLLLQVIDLSTPMTLRIEYRYNENGAREAISRRIKWNEFWDK